MCYTWGESLFWVYYSSWPVKLLGVVSYFFQTNISTIILPNTHPKSQRLTQTLNSRYLFFCPRIHVWRNFAANCRLFGVGATGGWVDFAAWVFSFLLDQQLLEAFPTIATSFLTTIQLPKQVKRSAQISWQGGVIFSKGIAGEKELILAFSQNITSVERSKS